MAKERKQRTATHRKTNKWLENSCSGRSADGTPLCEDWDGGYPECSLPWSHDKENGCKGNPFTCRKMYYKYLASSKKPSQEIINHFVKRENRREEKTE